MAAKKPYNCGIGPAFEVVGGKWKALIVSELDQGARHPGELRRLIARVSEKMLIQQLRELERDGVVHREVFPEIPPRVEYSLTSEGRELNKALGPLADWGEKYEVRRQQRPKPAVRARRAS